MYARRRAIVVHEAIGFLIFIIAGIVIYFLLGFISGNAQSQKEQHNEKHLLSSLAEQDLVTLLHMPVNQLTLAEALMTAPTSTDKQYYDTIHLTLKSYFEGKQYKGQQGWLIVVRDSNEQPIFSATKNELRQGALIRSTEAREISAAQSIPLPNEDYITIYLYLLLKTK